MSELIRQRGASSFFVRFTNKQNYFKVLTNALPVICPRRQKAHQYLSSATQHKNLILDYVIKPTFYNGARPCPGCKGPNYWLYNEFNTKITGFRILIVGDC